MFSFLIFPLNVDSPIYLRSGNVPTIDEVWTFMNNCSRKGSWGLIKESSAAVALQKEHLKLVGLSADVRNSNLPKSKNIFEDSSKNRRKRLKSSVFGTSKGSIIAGGTDVVLNGLDAYLRYLEGTARDDWQE